MTNACCGLAVIFCRFISLLIGRETINIPEIFPGVHGFTGKTINSCLVTLPLPLLSWFPKPSNKDNATNVGMAYYDAMSTHVILSVKIRI